MPEKWRLLYSLNPVVGVIDGFRWCLLRGRASLYLPGFFLSWASSWFSCGSASVLPQDRAHVRGPLSDMAGDVVIRAEGLGKKYVIGHEAERERYTALRDVIARNVKRLARSGAGSRSRTGDGRRRRDRGVLGAQGRQL